MSAEVLLIDFCLNSIDKILFKVNFNSLTCSRQHLKHEFPTYS